MLPRTTAAGLLTRRATSSPSILCYSRSFTALASRTVAESRPRPNLSLSRPASTRNFSICRFSNLPSHSYPSLSLALWQFYASSFRPSPFERQDPDHSALFATPSQERPTKNKGDQKDGTTAPQDTDEEVATAERPAERKAEEGRKEESSSGEEGREKSKEDEVRRPSLNPPRLSHLGSRASLIRVQATQTNSLHQDREVPVLLLDSPYSFSPLPPLFTSSASGAHRWPIRKKSPGKNSELPF